MARAGRPKKEIDQKAFESLCGLQCTVQEVADYFDASVDTIERWCKRTYGEDFADVFRKKRGSGKISLRRKQMQLAEKSPAMAIFLGKQLLGQSDKSHQELAELNTKIRILELELEEKRKAVTTEDEVQDPHEIVAPALCSIFDDEDHEHQIVTSGRAATKSSFSAILAVNTIWNDDPSAVVILRKRHNKLRKTVYKEVLRAINRMGLKKSDFIIGVSPMQVVCKKNGNVIYFSGSDSVDDTKGIIDEDKPIKLVIVDEATEFFDQGEGEDELTNIHATFVRGNDDAFRMLYLYNPPKNPNADINVWCRKMERRPDTIHTHIDYRDVPEHWLGRKLIEAADQLAQIDYRYYRWLWLGEQVGVDETIYYMFCNDHIQEMQKKKHALFIGIDYGQQNATTYQGFALDIGRRKLRGFDEYYHSGRESGKQKSPSEYAQDFKDWLEKQEEYNNGIVYVYIDPSAKGLAEEIKRICPNIHLRDAENDVKLGISRVQKLLTYDVMTISPKQEHAIEEFGVYMYDKKSIEAGKEVPVKVRDHCMDAIRYATMGAWNKLRYFLPENERD